MITYQFSFTPSREKFQIARKVRNTTDAVKITALMTEKPAIGPEVSLLCNRIPPVKGGQKPAV